MIFALILLGFSLGIVGYIAYCFFTAPKSVTVTELKGVDNTEVVGSASKSGGAAVVSSGAVPVDVEVGATTYRETTLMERLASATKKSATLFVQLATAGFLMLGNGVLLMADAFNAPEVRDFIKQTFTPEVTTGLIAFIVVITTISRVRSMFGSGA